MHRRMQRCDYQDHLDPADRLLTDGLIELVSWSQQCQVPQSPVLNLD